MMVSRETVRIILCNGLSKSRVKCIRGVPGWQDSYDPLPAHRHASIFHTPTLHPADTDDNLSLFLPDTFKQFLQTALACTILIQSASCQIACIAVLDTRCCIGKDQQSCTFKAFGAKIPGTCLKPSGVSLPITTISTP